MDANGRGYFTVMPWTEPLWQHDFPFGRLIGVAALVASERSGVANLPLAESRIVKRPVAENDLRPALATSVRWVLVVGAVGVTALLASLLPVGEFRIVLVGVAYIAALCVVSLGYIYASFTWRIPKLHWLGIVPSVLLGVVYATTYLMAPHLVGAVPVSYTHLTLPTIYSV